MTFHSVLRRSPCLAAPLFGLVIGLSAQRASASPWNLPAGLDDKNSTVTFEVDSTWHRVEGKAPGVAGELHLLDEKDPSSVRGTVSVLVERFDTDSSRRDSRLREVMAATEFPKVTYTIEKVALGCATPESSATCSVRSEGSLEIRGATRPFQMSGEITKAENGGYLLRLGGALRWEEFGVEDPSILIAKLAKDVAVSAVVVLNPPPATAP